MAVRIVSKVEIILESGKILLLQRFFLLFYSCTNSKLLKSSQVSDTYKYRIPGEKKETPSEELITADEGFVKNLDEEDIKWLFE